MLSRPGTIVSVCISCVVCFAYIYCHPLVGSVLLKLLVYVCVALTQSCIRHRMC